MADDEMVAFRSFEDEVDASVARGKERGFVFAQGGGGAPLLGVLDGEPIKQAGPEATRCCGACPVVES